MTMYRLVADCHFEADSVEDAVEKLREVLSKGSKGEANDIINGGEIMLYQFIPDPNFNPMRMN